MEKLRASRYAVHSPHRDVVGDVKRGPNRPARTESTHASVGAVPAKLFVREVEARGIDCSAALEAVGLSLAEMVGVRDIPLACCTRLIVELQKLVPTDDLGVLAGTRVDLSDLGLAGLYVRSEASGRDAFEFHQRHRELFEPSPFVHTHVVGDKIVVSLAPHPLSPAHNALAECVLASAVTLAEIIRGASEPFSVRLRHERPANDAAHLRIFGPDVVFGADIDAVSYSRTLLDRAMPYSDDAVRAVLRPHLARQLEAVQAERADLTTRALAAIREQLTAGTVSTTSLARQLRVSARSLRRELRDHGTSYTELLMQARRDLALQYAFESPRCSGAEIAQRLGYVDPHTFYRAFKRWTGVALSAYRKQDSD